MMKVSDPVMFGHCVAVYYADALEKHAGDLKEIGANVNNGLADVLEKLDKLPADKKAEIEADIAAVYATRPALAMVDSRKGITNLHVPNDVIVDASMPNVVRDGGRMWNKDDELQDTIAMVPDRCYATMYQAIIEDCQRARPVRPRHHGQRVQRGPDGPEGRGVRLPRQDLHGPGRRHDPRGRRRGQGAARAAGGARRHLPHVPDQGRAHPRLGEAGRDPRPRHRRAGGLLARREPRPRRRGSSRR